MFHKLMFHKLMLHTATFLPKLINVSSFSYKMKLLVDLISTSENKLKHTTAQAQVSVDHKFEPLKKVFELTFEKAPV